MTWRRLGPSEDAYAWGAVVHALGNLSAGFASAGLKAPTVILLADADEGARFAALIRANQDSAFGPGAPPSLMHSTPVEHPDGSVWMEIMVRSIAIRWPAQKRARSPNHYVWE